MAIEYLNQHQGFDRTGIGGTGKQAFKTFFKAQIRPNWLKKELPAAILDQAVMEAYSAWSKTKRNPKYVGKGKQKQPHPQAGLKIARFRSIRDKSQTLQFKLASDLKQGKLLPQYWGDLGAFECSDNGKRFCVINPNYTPEVTYKNGNFYLSLPQDTEVEDNGKESFIAFDPGVRTFLTGFDGNQFIEFGEGDINRIVRLCRSLDKMQSQRDLLKGHKNRHLRYQLNQKMKRKRRILVIGHWSLVISYWTTKDKGRRTNDKQVLECQCAKHGSILTRHTEEYTSKTCPHCGHIHQKLGGRKQFICPNCGFSLKRDFVGALGNFLKALWDSTVLSEVRSDCFTFTINV